MTKQKHAFPMGSDYGSEQGMTLRDWFAGQALGNPTICTGKATQFELRNWFQGKGDISPGEIIAKQAFEYANAMMTEREMKGQNQ